MSRLIDRRGFLAAAGTLAAGTLPRAARADAKRPPIVDTHLHCFAGSNDARFPYHANAPYRPEKPATPETLLRLMDGAGVDFAVVVHPEPYQDDHRYLEHCLTVGGKRLKGTCLFFADKPDTPRQLTTLAKNLPLVAARIHAYAPERLPPFGKPELRALWQAAGNAGLAVQLHFEPRYAGGFEPLIREFKDVRVIVDHLGRPFQGKPEEHAAVVAWAKYPNVIMKLSAIPTPRQYPHRDVAPIIQTLVDAFGPDRLISGGGFSEDATAASYRAERERIRGFLTTLSAADQAKVLGGTAARLFGFEAAS